MRRLGAASALALVLAATTGCADDSGTRLTVSAASSLTEAFGVLERQYERDHPSVDVLITYDSSATLAEQVVAGAPVDVLATADQRTMAVVTREDLTDGRPWIFTSNTLVLITPPDNPAGIESVRDLEDSDLTLSVCDPAAPCGAAARELLAQNRVDAEPDTLEEDVKAVLNRVRLGEADAGIVYNSDVATAGDTVHKIDIPLSGQVVNQYPIATIASSEHADEAADWISLVTSPEGLKVLRDKGFGSS